jgi:hypothetical protein
MSEWKKLAWVVVEWKAERRPKHRLKRWIRSSHGALQHFRWLYWKIFVTFTERDPENTYLQTVMPPSVIQLSELEVESWATALWRLWMSPNRSQSNCWGQHRKENIIVISTAARSGMSTEIRCTRKAVVVVPSQIRILSEGPWTGSTGRLVK